MASSTSTVITSQAKPDVPAARSRALLSNNGTVKPTEGNENDNFFWTYTEEPHRTRRQAIIKAHPEVGSLSNWQHKLS